MRSVVVVLPASMWAAIPMLRVHSIVYCRFGEFTDFGLSITASISRFEEQKKAPICCDLRGDLFYGSLPAKMCERFVGLGHLVHFIALANGVALALIGVHDFRRQRFLH